MEEVLGNSTSHRNCLGQGLPGQGGSEGARSSKELEEGRWNTQEGGP